MQLGYPTVARGRDGVPSAADTRTLVLRPPSSELNPLRPLLEGALNIVLIILFLGLVFDLTNARADPRAFVGVCTSLLLALLGFQGNGLGRPRALS